MAKKAKKPVVVEATNVEDDDADNSGYVKVEVAATPVAPATPPAAPVVQVPEKTEPKMVPVLKRAPTYDTEKKPSVLALNRQHMERRKRELDERNEAYMKGIAALQMQFGIAPNTPVPSVMGVGGHAVVPVASPHAQQLMAANAAAAAKK